jgi:hypothetical protein
MPTAWEKLRQPFPEERIGKLPRAGVELDYVGHADVTDRLLSVDPRWTWEPMALTPEGLPLFVRDGKGQPVGLWIRLTVNEHTRLGFGSVMASAFDAEKQLIGDALRNAAMRFGVALDLWRKEETHAPQGTRQAAAPAAAKPRWKHTEIGRGCPRPECDGSLRLSESADGTQRYVGCTNWPQDKGGCKYREDAPPPSAPPAQAGELDPRDTAVKRFTALYGITPIDAKRVLTEAGWSGAQRSVEWIAGLNDEEAVVLCENLAEAVATLQTEIPT